MQLQHSGSLIPDMPEDSSQMSQPLTERMLIEAFETLPDAVYLFGSDGRLIKANGAAAQLQDSQLQKGCTCCGGSGAANSR